MAFLVDTNVISTSAPTKPEAAALIDWMDRQSEQLYLSTITVAEIEDGIAKARRQRAHRKASRLAAWLETLLHLYAQRILPFDLEAARIAGRLSDRARGLGLEPGFADLAIAATAEAHRLIVLTHNTKDFSPLGVRTHDPFDSLPD